MSAYNRERAIKNQSGNYKLSYTGVFDDLAEAANSAESYPPGHPLHDMMCRDMPGYQVHHIKPLSAVEPLFFNGTPEQNQQIHEIIHSGNHLKNLFLVPSKSHYGEVGGFDGVHTRLKAAGLQPEYPKGHGPIDISCAHPFIQEIYNARNATFEEKLALAKRFKEELEIEYHNHLNDALGENDTWADTAPDRQQIAGGLVALDAVL